MVLLSYKLRKGNEKILSSTFLSDFILGAQDGMVNVLGIILGVSAATSDVRLIFVAGLAALGAETISMGAVAYTSTLAREKQYTKTVAKEEDKIGKNPKQTINDIKNVLKNWGYKGNELAEMAKSIASNPKAALEFLISFRQRMSPVDKSAPMKSFLTVLAATVIGSAIPLIPFIFLSHDILIAAIGAIIISGVALFLIGYYEAKLTVGSLWRSGLQMLLIGLAAGFAGYLIGHFIGALPMI